MDRAAKPNPTEAELTQDLLNLVPRLQTKIRFLRDFNAAMHAKNLDKFDADLLHMILQNFDQGKYDLHNPRGFIKPKETLYQHLLEAGLRVMAHKLMHTTVYDAALA